MSACSPRNVIVAKGTRAIGSHCESLPIGDEYRFADGPAKACPGVSLRVFIEREGEGS